MLSMKKRNILKVFSLFANVAIALTSCGGEQQQQQQEQGNGKQEDKTPVYVSGVYQNPMFVKNKAGSYYSTEVADPCVVKGDDGYIYSFSTLGRALRSEDGAEWEVFSESIIGRPSWGDVYATRPDIWAPDVVKVKDKWIYYYSLSAWGGPCGIGYAVADAIEGPYEDMGKLFVSEEVGGEYSLGVSNAIDPQVILDGENVYMVFGSFVGIYMVQLTEDGMGLLNGVQYQREHKVLIAGKSTSFNINSYEGSWIFKRGDYWYYMGSTGTCCNGKDSQYRVMVAKAEEITGPYIDSQGRSLKVIGDEAYGDLVIKSTSETVAGPGHNSVVKDDAGDYWWYGHCYYEYDNFKTRHLAMDKLEWDENDMPYVDGYELSYNEELDGPRWLED